MAGGPARAPVAGGQHVNAPDDTSPVERARAIRRAASLAWRDRVILLELSDYQGENGACWAKQTTIAAHLGIDARNLRRAISALESAGWITRGRDSQGLHTYRVTVPKKQGHHDPATGSPRPARRPRREGHSNPVAGSPEPRLSQPCGGDEEGCHDPATGSPEPRVTTTRVVTTLPTGLSRPSPQGHHDPGHRVVTTLQGTNQGSNQGSNQEQGRPLRAAPAPAKAGALSVQRELAQLEAKLDAELCADARAACALSRTNGKMADTVWLNTLRSLSAHPPQLANEAMRTFAGRYGDGEKDERYLLGIVRSLAKGKRRGGRGAGGMLPESTDFGASVDEDDLASLFGAQGAHA